MVLEQIIPNYSKLTVDDMVVLVHLLNDEIEKSNRTSVFSDAQWKEINRRIADADAHPELDMDWEDFKKDLHAEEDEAVVRLNSVQSSERLSSRLE